MKEFLTSHLMLSVHLVLFAFVLSLSASFTSYSRNAAVEAAEDIISHQVALMYELAVKTDSNEVDATIGSVIRDCPARTEFESLLSELGTLAYKDLIKVQQLFNSCGTFDAERKALMVARLEREYAVLLDEVRIVDALKDKKDIPVDVEKWNSLIVLERNKSEYLSELTRIQSEIITALISDAPGTQKTIAELVSRAQSLTQSLAVKDQQIDSIRNELTPQP